jgi:rod shape-determining protein MreC
MYRIFEFLYRFRAFLFFVLVEILCAWIIVTHNSYQGAAFFNTSNYYVASTIAIERNIASYFNLKVVNEELVSQNARLLTDIQKQFQHIGINPDTIQDSSGTIQYIYIPARVVKNSTRMPENYLTLNKGTEDGIVPDMGVVGPEGLVGRVKNVSKHYSTVVSMLHSGMNVAARIHPGNIDASVIWDGFDPTEGKVLHVVRHHKIQKGDSIVTSEYNAVFPANVLIGTIKEFTLGDGSSDYNITIEYSTDFTALSYVYLIKNNLRIERDSLENMIVK